MELEYDFKTNISFVRVTPPSFSHFHVHFPNCVCVGTSSTREHGKLKFDSGMFLLLFLVVCLMNFPIKVIKLAEDVKDVSPKVQTCANRS